MYKEKKSAVIKASVYVMKDTVGDFCANKCDRIYATKVQALEDFKNKSKLSHALARRHIQGNFVCFDNKKDFMDYLLKSGCRCE